MTHEKDLQQLLPFLKALPAEKVCRPRFPVDIIAQRGQNLNIWAQKDKDVLVSNGLDWSLVESLPARVGALRGAHVSWIMTRNLHEEAGKKWEAVEKEGAELRKHLLRTFHYAFRNSTKALHQLKEIQPGGRRADKIIHLSSLANLGKSYVAELEDIHFDLTILEEAKNLAGKMQEALSEFLIDNHQKEKVDLRNRAYTYLHMAMVEVTRCGQYVFFDDEHRRSGYKLFYRGRSRGKAGKKGVN